MSKQNIDGTFSLNGPHPPSGSNEIFYGVMDLCDNTIS